MKYLSLLFCLILCSCERSSLDGDCTDPIKLSKEKQLFNAGGGIGSVTMKNPYLLFERGLWYGEECEYIGADNSDYCNSNYCKNGDIMKIECSWFSVTWTDEYTLLVSVNKNETKEEKNQYVGVQGGNCFSGFLITQSPESSGDLWFNAKGGIDSITTEGESRYIDNRITIGDTVMTLVHKDDECSTNETHVCRVDIPFFESKDYYSHGIVRIEGPWFTIDKPDSKKVIFSVDENKTGKNRKFSIRLNTKDYFTNIRINQSTE